MHAMKINAIALAYVLQLSQVFVIIIKCTAKHELSRNFSTVYKYTNDVNFYLLKHCSYKCVILLRNQFSLLELAKMAVIPALSLSRASGLLTKSRCP